MLKLVVLSVVLASVAAKPSAALWGGHLAAPWAGHAVAPWAGHAVAPWAGHAAGHWAGAHVGGVAAAPLAPVGAYNYRGPLSLAPGQPANILAHDGRPLDTLSVNVDRAIHLTARAHDHGAAHLLGKRSLAAPWGAHAAPAVAWGHAAHVAHAAPAVAWGHAAHVAHAPLAVAAAAPWGVGHGAHWGHHW